MLYYNIVIVWDHRRICGPSLTEKSLCGAYLYCDGVTQFVRVPVWVTLWFLDTR
jgi:hypothetical protein